jgi:hypothetical protein
MSKPPTFNRSTLRIKQTLRKALEQSADKYQSEIENGSTASSISVGYGTPQLIEELKHINQALSEIEAMNQSVSRKKGEK